MRGWQLDCRLCDRHDGPHTRSGHHALRRHGRHLRVGNDRCIYRELSLGQVALQVVEHTHAERVFHVHSFHAGHVASSLRHTLAEAHDPVVQEGPGVAIGTKGIGKAYGSNK